MKPFSIEKTWIYPNVRHWTAEILKNLEQVNKLYKNEDGVILDVGGGLAPISDITNISHYKYILIDPNVNSLKSAPEFIDKREGCGEDMPISDDSVDIILTSSCLQYMDQAKFFDECKRVLKTGGLIAVHENGSKNPIIIFARLSQRVVGLFNKEHWYYRNTIKDYYYPKEIEGLKKLHVNRSGLLTPLMLYLQVLKMKEPENLYKYLLNIDNNLFKLLPYLRNFTFLNTVIYMKV